VVWQPREVDGVRQARLSDLLKLGDPRDPNRLREHYVLRTAPDSIRIIAGAPATASALRGRWRASAGTDVGATVGLAEFVVRQADLVLDIAERKLRGARYKVPRFVHEDVLWRPAFRGELAMLARTLGRDYAGVVRARPAQTCTRSPPATAPS
jgi:glycerol-3-phosphate O-acyltransferase